MNNHREFILAPITDILHNVVAANWGVGMGIETYPLGEYIMQSVFLMMTGSQEQKMKCICWELATYDYGYRYKRYNSLKPLGEFSTYDDKKSVYKDLIELLKKHIRDFDVSIFLNKEQIRSTTHSEIVNIFLDTNLSSWSQKNFNEFKDNSNLIQSNHFGSMANLLESTLQDKYTQLYLHRNRCAHNTLSYQNNLPTLQTMVDENYRNDNYFVRFALLSLLDKIFITLFKKYLDTSDLN